MELVLLHQSAHWSSLKEKSSPGLFAWTHTVEARAK